MRDGFGRAIVAHEGLTDEDGVGTSVEHAEGIRGGFNARLGNEENGVWDLIDELLGDGEVDGECFKITIIDSDEVYLIEF